ncbi:MAG: histidine kinase, partial [Chloroflexota bacterium]
MMLYALVMMLSPGSIITNNGRADLSGVDFSHNKLVSLNGQWEFYWDKLLMPKDFRSGPKPPMASLMKVPGVWAENTGTHYPRQGVATYRLALHYPAVLKDPALRIQNVANAYRLYVNGQLMAQVGNAS